MLTVSVLLLLTVSPELGLEPAWSRDHRPAPGAVNAALRLPEAHGREHVRHVVAMVAQINLGAGLEAEQSGTPRLEQQTCKCITSTFPADGLP